MNIINKSIYREVIWQTKENNISIKLKVIKISTSTNTYKDLIVPMCNVSRKFAGGSLLEKEDILTFHKLGFNIILI
jgi:hypothetical protein